MLMYNDVSHREGHAHDRTSKGFAMTVTADITSKEIMQKAAIVKMHGIGLRRHASFTTMEPTWIAALNGDDESGEKSRRRDFTSFRSILKDATASIEMWTMQQLLHELDKCVDFNGYEELRRKVRQNGEFLRRYHSWIHELETFEALAGAPIDTFDGATV